MITIWGRLEQDATDHPNDRCVQIRTIVPGSAAIRTYVLVDGKTLIARGTEQVALSSLREGEFVEVAFRAARTGLVKADAIYAQPEPVMSQPTSQSSARPQSSSQGSMQQALADPESACFCSDQPRMNTGSDPLDDILSTLMRQPLRSEAVDRVGTNARFRA